MASEVDRRVRARAIPPQKCLGTYRWKSGVTSHSKNWQILLILNPLFVQGHIIPFLLATCSVYPVWDRGQYFHVRMKSVPRVNCLLLRPRS